MVLHRNKLFHKRYFKNRVKKFIKYYLQNIKFYFQKIIRKILLREINLYLHIKILYILDLIKINSKLTQNYFDQCEN